MFTLVFGLIVFGFGLFGGFDVFMLRWVALVFVVICGGICCLRFIFYVVSLVRLFVVVCVYF